MVKTDFLVLGAGIAGLSYALKVARFYPDKKVIVISKADIQEGNTRYAQGGIAAVMDLVQDSFESHLADTLVAGGGLCERKVAEMVVREAPARIKDLLDWEVAFDSTEGGFHLGREGGHSHHRVLHSKDSTGRTIEEALVKEARHCPNILLLEHYFALDFILLAQEGENTCCGAYVVNLTSGKLERIFAGITLLASGGAGQVYAHTTNPAVATGDGLAMAARAGANISNMEFVQFHPTALYEAQNKGAVFLITEALRGFGAELRNKGGAAFMKDYDRRGSLAPRDVVARAITLEMHKTGESHVYLDARQLDSQSLKEHFPMIYEKCRSIGIDICADLIPVVPAAHYFCGGVKTDAWGRTSIRNLFASGECASTGLHGANRLASNSLLEALVFSHRASMLSFSALEGASFGPTRPTQFYEEEEFLLDLPPRFIGYRQEVQMLMDKHAGIIRNRLELKEVDKRLEERFREVEAAAGEQPVSIPLWELYNLLMVSRLVIKAALERREGVGLHYLSVEPLSPGPFLDQVFS